MTLEVELNRPFKADPHKKVDFQLGGFSGYLKANRFGDELRKEYGRLATGDFNVEVSSSGFSLISFKNPGAVGEKSIKLYVPVSLRIGPSGEIPPDDLQPLVDSLGDYLTVSGEVSISNEAIAETAKEYSRYQSVLTPSLYLCATTNFGPQNHFYNQRDIVEPWKNDPSKVFLEIEFFNNEWRLHGEFRRVDVSNSAYLLLPEDKFPQVDFSISNQPIQISLN